MSTALNDYFEALQRLIDNKPVNVPKGSKINNDTVALEAGRKRGSIKRGRELFSELIEAIDKVNKTKDEPIAKLKVQVAKYKEKADKYQKLYQEVLNRELMLLECLNKLEKIQSYPVNN